MLGYPLNGRPRVSTSCGPSAHRNTWLADNSPHLRGGAGRCRLRRQFPAAASATNLFELALPTPPHRVRSRQQEPPRRDSGRQLSQALLEARAPHQQQPVDGRHTSVCEVPSFLAKATAGPHMPHARQLQRYAQVWITDGRGGGELDVRRYCEMVQFAGRDSRLHSAG